MENVQNLTRYWLEKIVLGLDLCPFARIPYERGLVRITVCSATSEEDHFGDFLSELESLNDLGPSALSTTLIVYPYASEDFLEFNDFVGDLESMLEEAKLSSVYQLVAFHPKFVFKDSEFNDVGNYVNRSPYPVLHILRTDEMSLALKHPFSGEQISLNNQKKLRGLSRETLEQLFYYL